MNKFLGLVLALVVSAPALASSVDVDVSGAKCSVVQSDDGNGSVRTTQECATGAQLPTVKWNLGEYSLLADLSSKDIGAQYNVCPGLSLGLTGSASQSDASGDKKHDSKATVFAKMTTSLGDGQLVTKLSANRHQATDAMDSDGAALSAQYFFSAEGGISPFATVSYGYDQSTLDDSNKQTGSLSLGVRSRLR